MEIHHKFKDIFFRADPPLDHTELREAIEFVENPPTTFAVQEVEARLEDFPDSAPEEVARDAALRYAEAADLNASVGLLHIAGEDTATKLEVGIYAIEQQIEIARNDRLIDVDVRKAEKALGTFTHALEEVNADEATRIQLLEDVHNRILSSDTAMVEDAFYPIAAGDD